MNRLEERLAPLDGIAAVILWVAGVAVLQGKAHQPPSDASGARALQFFQVHTGTILAGHDPLRARDALLPLVPRADPRPARAGRGRDSGG